VTDLHNICFGGKNSLCALRIIETFDVFASVHREVLFEQLSWACYIGNSQTAWFLFVFMNLLNGPAAYPNDVCSTHIVYLKTVISLTLLMENTTNSLTSVIGL
jgi:hypothetical protein